MEIELLAVPLCLGGGLRAGHSNYVSAQEDLSASRQGGFQMVQLGYTVDLFSSRQGWLSDGTAGLHRGLVLLKRGGFQMVQLVYTEDL